jgi:pantoate--beta-alanine ligase
VKALRTKAEVREALAPERRAARSIGLVPTMGFLHEGHLSLIRGARERCDVVVVSLFVNPAQFGEGEDLEAYPRDEDRDAQLAAEAGADILWAPETPEVYPEGFATSVAVGGDLTGVLDGDPGRRGPAHFEGVTTVVAKLLNVTQPDVAFFGAKDAQQAVVVRRMAADLDFPVEIAVMPTVREPDGLALSSRNTYLSEAERERALAISRGLRAAEELAGGGERSGRALTDAVDAELRAAGIEPEYVEARDAETLSPVENLNGRPVLLAVAARVGRARLIDNVLINSDPPKEA